MEEQEQRKICRINGIGLDLVVSETVDMTADVTAYPVEDGEDVADHVHNQPESVTIDAIVSAMPLDLAGERGDDPVAQVRAALEELRSKRQPFVYEGLRAVFRSMIFENLSFPFDPSTGKALRFSATLRRVNLRELVRVASNFRPSRKSAGSPIWLCPSPAAKIADEGVLGALVDIVASSVVRPTNSAAINKRLGCRQVVRRGADWFYVDTGKKLTKSETMETIRQNGLPSFAGAKAAASGGEASGPSAKDPVSGTSAQPISFAPGEPAVRKMSEPKIHDVQRLPATSFIRGRSAI